MQKDEGCLHNCTTDNERLVKGQVASIMKGVEKTYYMVILQGDCVKSSDLRFSAMLRILWAAVVQIVNDWNAVSDFSIRSVLAGRCNKSNTRL